jgi:hypothetical protein
MITRNLNSELYSSQITVQPDHKSRKRFVFLTVFLLATYFTISGLLFAATIYIDPTYNSSYQNGSMSNPYKSWSKFTISSGNTYLQKAGTTFTTSSGISVSGKTNVTLGTYGTGSKAKIVASGSGNHIINVTNSSGITIKDLEVTSTGTWISGIIIQGNNAGNNTVNNCIVRKTEWGIRIITTAGGNKILKTTINDIKDDGIYAKDVSSIEIGFCTIYDINKKYLVNTNESYSAGDGIQLASSNNMNFNIHDNIIDHSSMGNKFCIIAWGNNYSGIIERNTIIANSNKNVSGIYLSPTTKTVTVRYNMIKNGKNGIYSYARVDAYYNAFANNRVGVHTNPNYTLNARNNVFYNNSQYGVYSTSSTSVTLRNNIFNMGSSSHKAIKTGGSISSNNNVFNTQHSGFINNSSSLTAWRNASGNDQNSMVGNPSFRNAGALDFHLNSNSVAINRGANVSLTKDYYGGLVPISGSPDAGISEYNNGKSGEIIASNDSIGAVKEMVLYPNPSVDGRFAVKLGKMYEKTDMDVFDMAGRLVKQVTVLMSAEGNVDMSTMPDGAYLIRVDTGVEKKTLKAIKNN